MGLRALPDQRNKNTLWSIDTKRQAHRKPQEILVVFDIETITDNDHHDGDDFTHEHRSEFAC